MTALTTLSLIATSAAPDDEAVQDSVEGFDSSQLLTAGIIVGAAIVVAIIANVVVRRILSHTNEIIARLAGRMTAMIIVIVGLIYGLSQVGIRVGLLLGALGVGGFALAFALQDVLSNLVAGIILQIRQPFTYDDYVSIEDYEGTVTDINLRSVEMKLFSGETVIIPSATVLQNPIENWTHRPHRRIEIEVGVMYSADMAEVNEVLLAAARDADGVLDDPPPMVAFDGFGDSSINFKVFVWFESTGDYFGTQMRTATSIKQHLDDAGIDIPFPIRTLEGQLAVERQGGDDTTNDRTDKRSDDAEASPADDTSTNRAISEDADHDDAEADAHAAADA